MTIQMICSAATQALVVIESFIKEANATPMSNDGIGELECRACAQNVCFILKVCLRETAQWTRLEPNGLLARSLEVCALCVTNARLQLPLLGPP